MLVVRFYLVDRAKLERRFHGLLPVSIWRGRSRNLSHSNPISLALDARGRTWFLTGITARGLSTRRCCDSAIGRHHHDQLRLANAIFSFWIPRPRLGVDLVLVLSIGRPIIEVSTPQNWNLFVGPMPHPATLRI
jgi:hypothetical protein